MIRIFKLTAGILMLAFLWMVPSATAQKAKPAAAKTPIFAVLGDGTSIEPIGYVDGRGRMTPAIDGASERKVLNAFHRKYFGKGKSYPLIFGGQPAGTVTLVSSDPAAECMNFLGKVTTKTTRTSLKGNVMALATGVKLAKPSSGVRRLPTPAERAEAEALVRGAYAKNGVPESAAANLRSHNLTALDVDSDANAELVGTYWVDLSATERGLLFFIAQRGEDGKYTFGHSEYNKVAQSETMSEDIKDVDSGVYHERLLDIFDVDGDGVAEIFSYVMSFEGAAFNVYKRKSNGWALHFEGSNYHCGY
jgi:hypothetical protein